MPRGFDREKSRKDTASLEKTGLNNWSPKCWTEPGGRKGKRALLACHTRCKRFIETTRNSVKVKFGIKVMKLMERLLGGGVTVATWSRIRISFNIRGRETSYCRIGSRIDHKTSWRTISSVPRCIPVWVAYWKVAWTSKLNIYTRSKPTPYNRIEHSDRIHHISDTI